MNRSDLVAKLSEAVPRMPYRRAEQVVNTIFESMEEAMTSGDRIEIRGFGSFAVKDYDGYAGRNPKTGVQINVEPKKLPVFKAGKEMKARLLKNPT
ncbi:integration host factor subunit beta (plasmid) [Trichlorobacter lovleyi]|uniref:HU family DNA-binding protein n=1 Tax=Trichlorobacter lovleyi TaxID=313985 RepID=UPI002240AE7E|nr:HU family DNA-binding protein [Trichlorobacter lovleyi]QOX81056.1 integration host factor subunit beta [Trichlorobacter lovleyi]